VRFQKKKKDNEDNCIPNLILKPAMHVVSRWYTLHFQVFTADI